MACTDFNLEDSLELLPKAWLKFISLAFVGVLISHALYGDPTSEACVKFLKTAGRNINELASLKKLPKTYGTSATKDAEKIALQIAQTVKPHFVVVGNDGVGKSQRIYAAVEKMPEGTQIVELNIQGVRGEAQGTTGMFEKKMNEKLEALSKEAIEKKIQTVVLYVPRIQDLIEGGSNTNNQTPAQRLIEDFIRQQAIDKTGVKFVVATEGTAEEVGKVPQAWRDYFQRIEVGAISETESIEIVTRKADDMSFEWGLVVDSAAVVRAVKIADQSTLPFSAIQLLDRAAALKKSTEGGISSEEKSRREEFFKLDRELTQENKKVAEALATVGRLEARKKESSDPKIPRAERPTWDTEQIRELTSANSDLTKAKGNAAELSGKREVVLEKWRKEGKTSPFVSEEDVVKASKSAKDAATAAFEDLAGSQEYWDRIKTAEEWFSAEGRLQGQPEAVEALVDIVERLAFRSRDMNRPIYVLMALGPSTVGKTFSGELLAEFLFGSKEAMIKLDLGEYKERHTVSRIIGSPPGYVKSEEGGEVTNAMLKKQRAVVMLDEMGREHHDIRDVWYSAFRDGYMTDARGIKVRTNNMVFFATSNLGGGLIEAEMRAHPDDPGAVTTPEFVKRLEEEGLMGEGQMERPFLNRFDRIIAYRPLTPEVLIKISKGDLKKMEKRFAEDQVKLVVEADALDFVSNFRYRPQLGAKNVKDNLFNLVEKPVKKALLQAKGPREIIGSTARVSVIEDAEGKAVGLSYEVFHADQKTILGKMEVRPSAKNPGYYDLFDPAKPEKIVASISSDAAEQKPAKKSGSEEGGVRAADTRGAEAVPEPEPDLAKISTADAAKFKTEVRKQLETCTYCRPVQSFDEGLIDWLSTTGYRPKNGSAHIAANIQVALQDPMNAISQYGAPANQDHMKVSYVEPDSDNFHHGAVKFEIFDKSNNLLKTYHWVASFDGGKIGGLIQDSEGRLLTRSGKWLHRHEITQTLQPSSSQMMLQPEGSSLPSSWQTPDGFSSTIIGPQTIGGPFNSPSPAPANPDGQ